jgi:hypothetical protein
LKEKKRRKLQEIQESLKEPLPDALTEEEEGRLRKELGLEARSDVSPRDLAKRKKLQKIKQLKEQLTQLDQEIKSAEESSGHQQHDLSEESPENTWSASQIDTKQKIPSRRAFDSPEEEPPEEPDGILSGKRDKESGPQRAMLEDGYQYLPVNAVTPLGAGWDKAGESHYVFLDGEIRYHGFKKMEDILPIWVFAGEKVPELLDRTQQWRFQGGLPFQAQSVAEIPREVRDFLLELRDRLRSPPEQTEGADEGAKSKDPDSPSESLAEEQAPEGSARSEPKRDLKALLESLEEEDSGFQEKTQAATLEEMFEKKTREKEPGGQDAPQPEAGLPAGSGLEDRNLGVRPKNTREILEEAGGAFEQFQKRRKEKKKLGPLPKNEVPAKEDPSNPYLGIFVALSNALGPLQGREQHVAKVLKSIEASYGRCSACVLTEADGDGTASVRITGGHGLAIGARVSLNTGLAIPIQRDGETAEILGYLYLRPIAGRQEYTSGETETARKVAKSIWAVLAGERKERSA